MSNSGVRRLEDLRREASAAARGLQADDAALEARELRILLAVSSAVAEASSLTGLLERAAETAREAVGAASASVSRWEPERELLRTLVNTGRLGPGEERQPQGEIYRLSGDDPLRGLLFSGRPYAGSLGDPGLLPLQRGLLERLSARCCAAVPIMVGDTAWGELWLSGDGERFGERDLRLLTAIAGQVAAGVARAELYGRMTDLAFGDELTGLANRHALSERLELVLERLGAGGLAETSLLLCDVDGLRALNQARGHHGGDWALKAVAAALRGAAEGLPDALVCRLSGDEFALLAPGASAETMRKVAERAIARLAGHRPPVRLSCGIASTREGARTPSELFCAADTALYTAKRSGRGRVVTADAAPAAAPRPAASPPAAHAATGSRSTPPG